MKNEITVDTLLRGQEKLDQMKREIRQVCSILVGAVSGQYIETRVLHSSFPIGEDGKWEVSHFSNDEVEIRFYEIDARTGEEIIFQSNGKKEFELMMLEDVSTIHANLPVLLNGLRQRYPTLDEYLQDYSNAA